MKSAVSITPELLHELLGPQKYDYTKIDKKPQVGAVTGLA
jgi:ATP-dependent Lon protease